MTDVQTPVTDSDAALDGVEMALLKHRFEGVVQAMLNTLLRTGRSGVLSVAHDFSCCIMTGGDELLSMAESLPVHVMDGPALMCKTMRENHPEIRVGDAFLHNSPYHGNSHAADWSILVPVFDPDTGEHAFTVLAKAHQADTGNATPTTYAALARDVYEEGTLIFPAVRVQSDYEHNQDIIRMCRERIRVPDQWWGDYLATLGAARVGERRLVELMDEYGLDKLKRYAGQWFDYSEKLMADAIRKLPAGRQTIETFHDPIPTIPDPIPLKVTVDVDPEAARISVDLTDNADCLPCGLNLSESTSRGAAMIGIFNSLQVDVPSNAGSFRCLEVHLRENCCVGIPRHPACCSVCTSNLMDRVANATQHAIAALADGYGMAEVGLCQSAGCGVLSGIDPRTGEPFVNQVFIGFTAGAGGPQTDGWLTYYSVGGAGMLMVDSVEIDEIKHPIRILEHKIVADTEGPGRRRGAPSAMVTIAPVDCEMEIMYMSDGSYNAAQGVRGGGAGGHASQHKRQLDGAMEELPNAARISLTPEQALVAVCSAGAGYGSPHDREPELVARDVRERFVTAQRAAEVYGVAVSEKGELDEARTAQLRAGAAR